jgi:hypothetical protein
MFSGCADVHVISGCITNYSLALVLYYIQW